MTTVEWLTVDWLAKLKAAVWGKCTVKVCPRQSPWRCRGCRQPVCNHHVRDPESDTLTGLCPGCRPSTKGKPISRKGPSVT